MPTLSNSFVVRRGVETQKKWTQVYPQVDTEIRQASDGTKRLFIDFCARHGRHVSNFRIVIHDEDLPKMLKDVAKELPECTTLFCECALIASKADKARSKPSKKK